MTVRATEMVKGMFELHSQVDCLLNSHPEKLKDSKFNTCEGRASFSQKFDEGVNSVFSTSSRHAIRYIEFGSPSSTLESRPRGWHWPGKRTHTIGELGSKPSRPQCRNFEVLRTLDSGYRGLYRDRFTQRLPTNSVRVFEYS